MTNNKKILAGSLSLFVFLMLLTPAPATATWTPKASTTENNTLPTGLTLPSWSTANLIEQNTPPTGTMVIDNNQADGSEVNTQPNGTAANIARDNTGSETNTKPTGSASVNALTADGSETNTQPSGTVATVARDNDGSEVNTRPSGANDPNAQTVNANKTISEPDADVRPSEQTTNSTIGNTQPTGAPTPNAQSIATTDQAPTNEPASFAETASTAENNWYLGTWALAENTGNLAVDDSSTGSFVEFYLDLDGDGTYLEDTDSDNTTGSLTSANEDIYLENIQVSDTFTIDGIYYRASLAAGFTTTDNTAYITSNTWAEGNWSIDADNDGVLDNLHFVMVDNNSNDNFDMIVISFDNTAYNDGNTNNATVDSTNDENEWATGNNLTIGAYNWNLTTLAIQPETATDDAGITMDTWYYNEPATAENVWIDNEGSGTLVELYYCIWDPDSDSIFENVALSIDDQNYGEGSLENKILGSDDDESLSITGSTLTAADNIQISVVYDFEVSFTSDPEGDATDFSIDSTSWYYAPIRMDVGGDGSYDNLNFVLSDDNSDGVFDNLEISSDDNTFGELGDLSNKVADTNDDELLGAADNVRIGDNYDFEVAAPVGDPQNDTPDFSITSTSWFTGTLSIDVDGDDATEAVNFSLGDDDSDGVFNVLEISVGDAVYGENVTSDSAYTDNDAKLTGTDNIRIGENASQSYQYEVMGPVNNPADETDYSVTSTSWWTGVIVLDVDGDGVVDNEVNFCISDSNSNGIFDNLDISSDDSTFGEGTVTDDNAYADNDVRIGAADNVQIGASSSQSYQYEVEFASNPISGTPTYDFQVTSTSWYEGTLNVDIDDDGNPDAVNFCLSDNNSDGFFDNLDISADATYGEDITGENENKVTSASDVRVNALENLIFGDYNDFEVMGPANNPVGDLPDFRVKSKSWYKGSIGIDINGDGSLDNLYVTLLDENSDGQFDNYELSAFNDNFGQGTGMLYDNLIAENLAENNDERLDAYTDNLLLGPQKTRHEVAAPTQKPQDPTESEDFRIRAKSWYEGAITLHGGNDFNFVIWNPDSDGIFENLVFDDNQDNSYAGDSQYNSYPVSPVRLPRGSRFAYKVIWFDNEAPPYTDPTYGTNDLAMQPLDTTSPTFSDLSPVQGATVKDSVPTISVNLSDQATGSYKFDIEPGAIVMKVNDSKVSCTYSGGTVSYTPKEALPDGDTTVSVTASDYAKNSASTSWSFTIETPPSLPANTAPTANPDGPYYVKEGETIELDGTGSSDPEGDALTYSWTITNDPTGGASLTNASTATPTFYAPENVDSAVDVTVKLTVNDGHEHSDSATTTTTILKEFETESEATIDNIGAGESVDAAVENTSITGLRITAKNSVQNVHINVGQFAEKPSGVPPASGTPYKYMSISTENLSNQDVENVTISFKVENSWITEENIGVNTIVLQRYNPATGSWDNLPTENVDEDANFVHFEATSSSLSTFAVAGSPAQLPTAPAAPAPPYWVMILTGLVLVTILLAVIWRYLTKGGRAKKMGGVKITSFHGFQTLFTLKTEKN